MNNSSKKFYIILMGLLFTQLSWAVMPGFNLPSTANPAFVGQRAVPESLQQPKPLPSPLITVKSAPDSKPATMTSPNNKKVAPAAHQAKTKPAR